MDSAIRRLHLQLLDLVVAVILAAIYTSLALNRSFPAPYAGPIWLAVLVCAALTLPVAVRRWWPVTVLAVLLPVASIAEVLGIAPLSSVPVMLALYTVAAVQPPARSLLAFVLAVLATSWPLLVTGFGSYGMNIALSVLGWALGLLSQRRSQDDLKLAEQREQRAVLAERLRIARDLHDIVAHSMSLIAVKAGVANHLAETRPAETREALAVIEATSRGALDELRRMLGVLRSADGPEAELRPAHGLAELPELVRRAEEGGLAVELDIAELELPEGIQQAVYRIVQEALTNVRRHSGATSCKVRLTELDGTVAVEVSDPGGQRATTRPGSGLGLIGMRERVAAYGGSLNAGPAASGGFRVCALLPVTDRRAAGGEA